jgi:spoIIIJ-associated protein
VEWVEVTGKTVEEAKEAALDQLGVTEVDAEVVVVAEPKTGLFGRVRGEARVRARVRPVGPRPKRQRRQRDRGRNGGARGGARTTSGRSGEEETGRDGAASAVASATSGPRSATSSTSDGAGSGAGSGTGRSRRRRRGGRGRSGSGGSSGSASSSGPRDGSRASVEDAPGNSAASAATARTDGAANGRQDARERAVAREERTVAEGMTLQEQAEVAKEFLEGLMDHYGLDAAVEVRELDEETVELAADGEGLGVLVGPKGATLAALQDVTRAVVQRRFPTRTDRILVDVAGYRERRAAALRRFSQQVASEVVSSGEERALEPMSPADRKVVHDTVTEIEGVASRSEGEDPNRYVVIAPAPGSADDD